MPRQPLRHDLPPLHVHLADFRGFGPGDVRGARIADLLRPLARDRRADRPAPFYPLRETADFFGVSIPTAAAAYRRLEEEGLLTSRRGSMTLVPSRAAVASGGVRGVVGVPVWTPGFVRFRDWRIFISGLDEAVCEHGWVADLIFYRQGEELAPAFATRVLRHRPDALVWFMPADVDWGALQRIEDAGVQVLVVSNAPTRAPARRYVLDRSAGLRRGLREWRAAGIDTVLLPQFRAEAVPLAATIERLGGPHPEIVAAAPDRPARELLASLTRTEQTAIFFDLDFLFVDLCLRAPHELVQLMSRRRVAVTKIVDVNKKTLDVVRVDTLIPDLAGLARRIADDIATERHRQLDTVTLQTRWHTRVLATSLDTHLGME